MPTNIISVYYAHPISLYNTAQEARDVHLLKQLGFEVFNPNTVQVQEEIKKLKEAGDKDYMNHFKILMDRCGACAFRSFPDGRIGAGVWFEIKYMRGQDKPIIELPNLLELRAISVDDTREYLKLVGKW